MPGLADLLGGGALGGGAGGSDESDPLSSLGALSSEDARRLSLVQALGQIQEAGTRRTASPIGAIANALLPLLTAPIAARQAEAQSRAKLLPALVEMLKLKREQENDASGDAFRKDPKAFLDKILGGQSNMGDKKVGININAEGQPSFSISDKPMTMDTITAGALDGDPKMVALHDKLISDKEALARINAGATAQARMPYELLLAGAAETRREDARRKKPIPTSMVAFDADGNRVSGASQGAVEDGVVTAIPKSDADAVAQAQEATRQLKELKALSAKILPKYSAGYGARAITLGENLKERFKANPDQARFDMLSNFANLPAISALNRMRRLPLAEVNKLSTPSRLLDTQESANAKIDELQNMLSGLVGSFGLDPAILDKPTTGRKPVRTLPDGSKVYENQ